MKTQSNSAVALLPPLSCSSVAEDTIRLSPDGKPFRILKVFKAKVHVCGELGGRVSKDRAEVEGWELAEIPDKLSNGEKLFYGERRVTVTGFERMPFGMCVLLTDEDGHESLWPACQSEFFAQMVYRRNRELSRPPSVDNT